MGARETNCLGGREQLQEKRLLEVRREYASAKRAGRGMRCTKGGAKEGRGGLLRPPGSLFWGNAEETGSLCFTVKMQSHEELLLLKQPWIR
jgi:hypothetical protein